jgi:hypothetical protein
VAGIRNRTVSNGLPPEASEKNKKAPAGHRKCLIWMELQVVNFNETELPGKDSNLDKEYQKLLCYRYTTG